VRPCFPAHHVRYGDARIMTEVVFSSVPHTLFWLWLMPLAFSMCVRAVYRSEMREMRMAKIRKKLM